MAGYEKTCPALDPGENNVYIQYVNIYIYIAGMGMCINVKVTINIGKYKLTLHIYIYAYFLVQAPNSQIGQKNIRTIC